MPVGTRIKSSEAITMKSIYHDTEDKKLKKRNIAFRKRVENGQEICYLKIRVKEDNNLFVRNEYAIETDDLKRAFDYFVNKSELKDFFEGINYDEIKEICVIEFDRSLYKIHYSLNYKSFDAELCFDVGWGKKGIDRTPISEIELEFLNGDEELFRNYAIKLEEIFMLDRESMSKIAQIK